MSMNTIPSSFALTRTSLIVNRVPRSRTISPDLTCFAFSIIFILPSLSSFPVGYAEEENQNQSGQRIISETVLVLTFSDIRLTPRPCPGLRWQGKPQGKNALDNR